MVNPKRGSSLSSASDMDINRISNNLTNGSSAVQKQTLEYFQSLNDNPNGWKICVEALSSTSSQESLDESRCFFCLMVIESYIRTRYEEDTTENQAALKQFVFSWFSRSSCQLGQQVITNGLVNGHSSQQLEQRQESSFLLNKFAQLVTLLCLTDFPNRRWDSFFHDFMRLCSSERSFTIFLKVLLQLNQEIADREFSKSLKEAEKGTFIKDLMREVVMMDLASFWFNVIESYQSSCPALICLCLEVIGNYVAWIDISLVTNECFMTRLFSMFDKKEFQCSVCDCFSGILHKGMDPLAKTTLIQQFVSVPAIKVKLERIANGLEDVNDEFLVKLAKLTNTIGVELIEAFKKTKHQVAKSTSSDASVQNQQHLTIISEAIESKFPLLCFFLSLSRNPLISIQVHPFAREYIQWLKKQDVLEAKTVEVIKVFIRLIVNQSRFPSEYDFSSEDSNTEFDECRKSCRILFENLMCLNVCTCVDIVCQDLLTPVLSSNQTSSSSSNQSFCQVEVSLYMLFLLGENMNVLLSNQLKRMEQILTLVITSNVSSFPHSCIQSIYFDIITRYDKVFGTSLSHLIPQILISFLDERGFKHPNSVLRSKVCHLFNKFIKGNIIKGKAAEKIHSFAEEIIKRLQDLLVLDLTGNPLVPTTNGCASSFSSGQSLIPPSSLSSPNKTVNKYNQNSCLEEEDQLVLYETIATLIISNSNCDPVKKHLLLKSFLIEPLWKSFDSLYSSLVSILVMTNGSVATTTASNIIPVNGMKGSSDPRVSFFCNRLTHCIFLVSRTSKAFSNVHPIKSINGQGIYLDSFNNFVKVLSLDVGQDNIFLLQSALRQLMHRLVVCLEEAEIVPLLPVAIERIFLPSLVMNNTPGTRLVTPVTTSASGLVLSSSPLLSSASINFKTIQEMIPLINQVVTKFKHSWMFQRDLLPFLRQIFVPLVSSIFTLTSTAGETEDSLTPDEVHSLQKCYYTFLSVLSSNNIMEVFTNLEANVFDQIMTTVVQAAVEFPDFPTQKLCFGILKKMIEHLATANVVSSSGELLGKSPSLNTSFIEFMYKNIVPACFYAPLKPLDPSFMDQSGLDPNQLVAESVSCLKTILTSRGGQEVVSFLQNQFFTQHFPAFAASPACNELLQCLMTASTSPAHDLKSLREVFKTRFVSFHSNQQAKVR